MDNAQTQQEWSQKVAVLAVDMLIRCKLANTEDFQRAVEIVAEEILVRLCLGDLPPTHDPSVPTVGAKNKLKSS